MSTHTGLAYLNSCIKVPIDPCNNCPAPVYNRPKLCMGKKSKSSASNSRKQQQDAATVATTSTWTAQTGIRSLAKFYDSIPDYCQVKHLHKAEFYSTLESLRSTSRELRAPAPAAQKERCPSVSSCSSNNKTKQRNGKGKKLKKQSTSLFLPSCSLPEQTSTLPSPPAAAPHSSRCLSEEYEKCVQDLSRLKSFKQDFALEVADFKRSLKSFEMEFKRNAERPKSTSTSGTQTQVTPKMPAMHTAARAKHRSEMLRKCYSVNDLRPGPDPSTQLSCYFPAKVPESELPKLHIESPSVSSNRSSAASGSCRRRRRRRSSAKVKAASAEKEPEKRKTMEVLHIFELETATKHGTSSVSPQHPVARPNLAATLRAEVSRKKVKELQNNCTYHDPRPQFDWEVRKTPAWKSLSLNEPHKALLSIRLATRKAEQSLQERQYDLHMQMMRQRVKSAPLLLEGPTYWGPEVGKLSHTCRTEGMRHACESSQQRRSSKQQKKKCSSSSSCKNSSRCTTAAVAGHGDRDVKLQQLRKIYGSQSKPCTRQTQSRRRQTEQTPEPHDSGDDLCSVDRAFL